MEESGRKKAWGMLVDAHPRGLTLLEISRGVPVNKRTACRYLHDWRLDVDNPLHVKIVGWTNSGISGSHAPLYGVVTAGTPDTPKPTPLTGAEKQRRYRAKMRAARLAGAV